MRITRWDQICTTEFSNEVLLLLSDWHLSQIPEEGIDERVQDITKLVKARDYYGLCHYELEPTGEIETYRHLRQVLAFFQKRADLDLGIDTADVAWNKFVETEARCRETNEIFRLYSRGGFYFRPCVESVLYVAQRKISAILGDLPSLEALKLRFGPGATTQVKRRDASARRKLAQMFCVSEDAIRLLPDLLAEVPLWSQVPADDQTGVLHTVLVTEGRISFVRKTAKTDRTIIIGPLLNGFVQNAVGDWISDCLRSHGVDLRDQSLNQRLAKLGSTTGGLATLDMSSASDLVACGLVESLLPYDWWDFLRSLRTSEIRTGHKVLRLEKFSSMGDGFTFALESLIFYSIAKAAEELSEHRGPVNVYGDDIIVPVGAVPLLIETLEAVGFIINQKKSYWSGPFRESCGKDYFSGIDVRPTYVKDVLTGHTCFVLHNFYVRTGQPVPASLVLDFIDESLRIWGPDGFGDGHLLGDHSLEPHGRNKGWGGYTFETYTYRSKKAFYSLGADYVYPSYSIYLSGPDVEPQGLRRFGESPSSSAVLSTAGSLAWRNVRGRVHGSIRPDHEPARYGRDKWGRWGLQDTLPGVEGYKRVKIYTLGIKPTL